MMERETRYASVQGPARVTLQSINQWHMAACPRPDQRQFDVMLGVMVEEIEETLKELRLDEAHEIYRREACTMLDFLATALKKGQATARIDDRQLFVDGLADVIVTCVGTGWRANMDVPLACDRVDISNWSKFVDGKPLYDENGKVVKGPNYKPARLEGCY